MQKFMPDDFFPPFFSYHEISLAVHCPPQYPKSLTIKLSPKRNFLGQNQHFGLFEENVF